MSWHPNAVRCPSIHPCFWTPTPQGYWSANAFGCLTLIVTADARARRQTHAQIFWWYGRFTIRCASTWPEIATCWCSSLHVKIKIRRVTIVAGTSKSESIKFGLTLSMVLNRYYSCLCRCPWSWNLFLALNSITAWSLLVLGESSVPFVMSQNLIFQRLEVDIIKVFLFFLFRKKLVSWPCCSRGWRWNVVCRQWCEALCVRCWSTGYMTDSENSGVQEQTIKIENHTFKTAITHWCKHKMCKESTFLIWC